MTVKPINDCGFTNHPLEQSCARPTAQQQFAMKINCDSERPTRFTPKTGTIVTGIEINTKNGIQLSLNRARLLLFLVLNSAFDRLTLLFFLHHPSSNFASRGGWGGEGVGCNKRLILPKAVLTIKN